MPLPRKDGLMNATNILSLYATWYKDIDITIDSLTSEVEVFDKRTKSIYYIHNVGMIARTFRDLGNTRIACGLAD